MNVEVISNICCNSSKYKNVFVLMYRDSLIYASPTVGAQGTWLSLPPPMEGSEGFVCNVVSVLI
jgi:hypothetical protein